MYSMTDAFLLSMLLSMMFHVSILTGIAWLEAVYVQCNVTQIIGSTIRLLFLV